MKKYIRYSLLIVIACSFAILSCNKEPDLRMPDVKEAVTPYMSILAGSKTTIDLNDFSAFHVDLVVDLLFKEPFQKLNVMVVRNGDFENPYQIGGDITSVPATLNITTAELIAAIPALTSNSDILVGDTYVLFVNTTMTDGTFLPGYLADGNLGVSSVVSASVKNLKGSNAVVGYSIAVPCPFIEDLTIGTYDAVSIDWNAAGPVTFTADPADPYTIYIDGIAADVDFLVGNGNLITLTIDPETYEISGDPVVLAADCGAWGPGYEAYTNYTYAPVSGIYNTCDGSYTIVFEIYVDQGGWGENEYTFTRN